MSLRAKLEAVIYAAEEPVTLAQLALLFTADALEWKAEQDAAVAAQAEAAAPGGAPLPLTDTAFTYLEAEGNAAEAVLPAASEEAQDAELAPVQPAEAAAETVSEAAAVPDSAEAPADAALAQPAEAVSDPESELKREARQRDRDVRNVLRTVLDELIAEYATADRGIEIREVAGGYRMATKPECHDAVRGFVKSLKPPLKLSLPALETLAVIAYKQPVTAPEVNEIRGVDSSGVFGSLLSRKLITTAGRKQVVGRPILYKTTREFLLRFGLKDIAELPSMEEFEKLAAIELEEPEVQGGEEAGAEADANEGPELDESASEEPEANGEASNSTERRPESRQADTEATSGREPAGTAEVEPIPHD